MSSDFTGFTYNNIHSSTYHLTRVSDGTMYENNVLPTLQDKTTQIPGGDGTYYFKSYYTQRTISVAMAYDSLSETDIRDIRNWFNGKTVYPLVFDELPYKTYYAKVNSVPKFSYISFDESNSRVYKGTLSVSFVCFDPYAHCVNSKKYLNQYTDDNVTEWSSSSGLLASKGTYDTWNGGSTSGTISLYNGGDIDTYLTLDIDGSSDGAATPTYSNTVTSVALSGSKTLNLSTFNLYGADKGIRINMKSHLIEGYAITGTTIVWTGNIYNKYITSGDFFTIPTGTSTLTINGTAAAPRTAAYDYLYL